MQHELDEIDAEIASISHVLSRTPDDHPNLPLLLTCLGKAHKKRYNLLEEPDDIQKTIKYTTILLTLIPDDDQGLPGLFDTLGTAHGQRFQRLGEVDDIKQALKYNCLALESTPDGHPALSRRLANLGVCHKVRYQRYGEVVDIEKSIEYDSRALVVTPNDDPRLSDRLQSLGSSHSNRFERLGELDDLEKAIEHQYRGLALAPDNHPRLPTMLAHLATSHGNRFQRLGELDDLEKEIQYDSRALALTPDGHRHFSGMLANLGASHSHRFKRLGELDDLEKAIEYSTRALSLTSDGHPQLPSWLANLGAYHSYRFKRLDELGDLEKAVQYQSRALALTPDGYPHLPSWLVNLGVYHGYRFHRLGELDDLEKAVQYESRALSLTPDGHPDLSRWLTNLGASHIHRFEYLGELGDLERAIQHQSCALALTPDGHPHLSGMFANLGTSHKKRYKHLGKLDDLDKAIQYESRALALTPDSHPDLRIRLANLGGSHSHRFRHLRKLDDLEKGIQHQSHALDLTPDGHPNLSDRISDLGTSHCHLFQCLGQLENLDKAIECHSCAVEASPANHPDFCSKHLNLALSHVLHYENTGDPSHLQDSLHSFRIASSSPVGAPRVRFKHACQWATYAFKHSALNCIEAYQTTIDLLPQFIWLGATTAQRYEDLRMAETLAIDAASAAILSSNYSLALEWLEHARCVVWNQHLMLRSPLEQLQASHPCLAIRLQTVANQLHSAGSESRDKISSSGSMNQEQVGQEHRRLAKEYNDLLTQTRALPEFEDFLRPMKVAGLLRAAKNGPIVVINCHKDRCDALLVLPEESNIAHLPLPNFTREKAQATRARIEQSLSRHGLRERGVHIRREPGHKDEFGSALAILWNDVVKPILDYLGYTSHAQTESLPHITWCPTGAASFLPLHAAGDYDQPHSRIFEYAVSSFTPTITALLASTSSNLGSNSRVLAIGQEVTPGHRLLPGSATELAYIKSHVGNRVGYSQLMDAQATPSTVLDAMEQHDWVHLACHAHQNVYDPTMSGFFLHGGTLDLASINRRTFKKKGLAFLSACQTAKGDERLPDEAVHLASGMLMAGYSSVIATMWSVVDQDAPFVADKVYGQLMIEGKVGNGEAGKALHNAIAGLREKIGEKEFGRWVPYIHIGS